MTPAGTLSMPINGQPACGANGGTVGFAAASPAEAGTPQASRTAGPIAKIPRGSGKAVPYLAYLRDPAGNKICACTAPAPRPPFAPGGPSRARFLSMVLTATAPDQFQRALPLGQRPRSTPP